MLCRENTIYKMMYKENTIYMMYKENTIYKMIYKEYSRCIHGIGRIQYTR